MRRVPVLTKDGSPTLSIPEWQVTYRSVHGAFQESRHVFIEAGFAFIARKKKSIRILEMGFGTGLNALLTLLEAEKMKVAVDYTALETYPLTREEATLLHYCQRLEQAQLEPLFEEMHSCEWEKPVPLHSRLRLCKRRCAPLDVEDAQPFDLIYYDAFAPRAQPALWTAEVFAHLYRFSQPGAALVTYCSKSIVRRAMQTAGYTVSKLPGPRGKREMLRAERPTCIP